MLLDIEQIGNELRCSKINKDKILEFLYVTIPANEFFEWSFHSERAGNKPDPIFKHWFKDTPVFRKRTKYLNKFRLIEFIEKLDDETKKNLYEFNEPYKLFCDIETEVIDGFPDVNNPKEKVTCIGLFNESDRIARVYGIKELSDSEIKKIENDLNKYFEKHIDEKIVFEYRYFSEEKNMLKYMFEVVFKEALVITGWNFIRFDWNYLTARAERLGINPGVCSADKKLSFKEKTPKHKLVVDYLDIFKKWGYMDKELENFTLDNVAKIITGLTKIQHTESLQSMFENNFTKYIYYNIVDVILVQLIDKQKKTFLTMCKIAQLGLIEARKAFSPVAFTEAVLCRDFYKIGKVCIDGYNPFESENIRLATEFGEKIEGGFVHKPLVGLFKLLGGVDFASLYPSIMRMFGTSPEAYLGYNVSAEDGVEYIETIWKTKFKRGPSVMKRLLDDYYGQRQEKKKIMKFLDPKIKILKDELKRRKEEKIK